LPNLGSEEGVELLQFRRSLSPLKWHLYCGVWPCHIEEASADLPPLSNVELKNEWSFTATFPYAFTMHRWTTLPLPLSEEHYSEIRSFAFRCVLIFTENDVCEKTISQNEICEI
jgi:hypothetical protein